MTRASKRKVTIFFLCLYSLKPNPNTYKKPQDFIIIIQVWDWAFFQKIMLVSAFGARLRQHLKHLCGNFSKVLQRKKQKGTDLEIKRESIIRFCNFMHSIFRFTKTEFSFPWGLLSRYPIWSGNVRSILCWFYGWEDENRSEIAVVIVSWGTTEFLLIFFL